MDYDIVKENISLGMVVQPGRIITTVDNNMKSHMYTGAMIMMVITMIMAIGCCRKFRRELLGGIILTSSIPHAENHVHCMIK